MEAWNDSFAATDLRLNRNIRKATGAIVAIMRAFVPTVADENKGVKRPEDDGAFFEPKIPRMV